MGLRYDLNLPLYWKGGQAAAFNPSLKVIEFPSEIRADLDPRKLSFPATIPVPLQPLAGKVLCGTDKNNLAPRIGLAYRPFRSNNTVIRAGYGVFYQVDQFNSNCGSGTSLWSFSQTTLPRGPGAPPVATLAAPFAGGAVNSSLSLPANVPELHVTPYIQQWSFGIQREITPSLVLEVRYLGSKGTKLNLPVNLNQAPLCPSSVLNAPGGVTTCGNTTNVSLANSLAARRPLSSVGLLSTINMTSFAADSNFNALNVRLEKRTSGGLTFLASYGWNKSTDTSSGGGPQNVYDLAAERGLSAFDTRQRAVFSSTYELPFGNGRRFGSGWRSITQALFGGWQVSEIFTAQAGASLTATLGTTDNSLTGGGNDRPDLVGDPHLSDRTSLRWFNTAAFAIPARGTFGNAGRGVVTGPGSINLDLAVKKSFALRENHNVEFRSEFFNATNTPHFNNPNMVANLPNFGQITTAGAARQIQFALRYTF